MNELKRNGSGYFDPTAFKALKNIYKQEGSAKMEVYKGDIFFVDKYNKDYGCGSEQSTGRPAIIVSNDMGNKHSSMVEVVYLTSQEKKPLPTHVEVICQVPSIALCEQICSVSKERLSSFVRTCTDAEMKKIDEALMISLGIECAEGVPAAADDEKDAYIEQLKDDLEVRRISNELLIDELNQKEAIIKSLTDKKNDVRCEGVENPAMTVEQFMLEVKTERNLYKQLYENLLEKMMA